MAGLKPQEIRCLLLKAEGLSYQEICEVTGWTYTKVNRCLTEGRRAFLARVARIESGAECERLAPLISKVADGEASPDEMRTVRPHLKSCLACKATLREYRATPSRVAGLVPPVVALAGGGGGVSGWLGRIAQALHDRFGTVGDAAGAKLAAVAASAAVVAGGGAAGIGALDHDQPAMPASAYAPPAAKSRAPAPNATANASLPASAAGGTSPTSASGAIEPSDPPPPTAVDERHDALAAAEPGPPEFDPGTAGGSGSVADTRPAEFGAPGAGSGSTGDGGGSTSGSTAGGSSSGGTGAGSTTTGSTAPGSGPPTAPALAEFGP